MRRNAPQAEEIEVSVFGTGGRGESVAIHLGNGRWMVVDTCMKRGRPAVLDYLDSLEGADPQKVSVIAVSHWDEDHVGGLEALLDRYPSSLFMCSRAFALGEFGSLLELEDRQRWPDSGRLPGRSAKRLARVFKLRLLNGAHEYRLAQADDTVIDDTGTAGHRVRIMALSPSRTTMRVCGDMVFKKLLDRWNRDAGIRPLRPNDVSLVLWVEVGDCALLLGGDLVRNANPGQGWNSVIDRFQTGSRRADFFKIPHHGAKSAYDTRVWENMVRGTADAATTFFALGGDRSLPTAEDRRRLVGHKRRTWIVGEMQDLPDGNRWRFPAPGRTRRRRAVPGHLRLRRLPGDSGWGVDIEGVVERLGEPPPRREPQRHRRRNGRRH